MALDFEIPVNDFLAAASKAVSVSPSNSPKPVLSSVLIRTKDQDLELVATDAVTTIVHRLPSARIYSGGSGLINAAKLAQLLKQFRDLDARLTFDSRNSCKFRAKGGDYSIYGQNPQDFPLIKDFSSAPGVDVPGVILLDMLARTIFAAAPDQGSLAINGIKISLEGGEFKMAATDNKRLAVAKVPLDSEYNFEAIVPADNLKIVSKILGRGASEDVTIGVSGSSFFVEADSATVSFLMVNGRFPAYESVLNVELPLYADCSRDELSAAISRARLVDETMAVLTFDSNKLQLRSKSIGVGSSTVELDVDYTGDSTKLGFNPSFIEEALSVMKTKKCRFKFKDNLKAGMLRELEKEDDELKESEDYVYAFMPYALPDDED